MKKTILQFIFTLSLFSSGIASASLESRIDSVINGSRVSKVIFGVEVVDADSGQVLYTHNSKTPLTPASNMKLISSSSALHYLGRNFEYTTKVYLVDNDVIVVGAGDPLLGDEDTDMKYGRQKGWFLEQIANLLAEKGVNCVNNIIVDSSIFDDNRTHPSWPRDQLNRYYACQVSGLNYNGNCIEVGVKNNSGNINAWLIPKTNYIKLINKAKPNSKRDNTVWCARPFESNTITLYGKCYREAPPIKVTVDRPAVYFGYLLAERLICNGIKVSGCVQEKYAKDAVEAKEPLLEFKTPLSDVFQRCNGDSFGLAAECLVKTVSSQYTHGKINGEWEHGKKMAARYLESLGIESSEFVLDDGSGLSAKNKVSANSFCLLLKDIYKSDDYEFFKNALAVGGVSGSSPVRAYFKDAKYKGKIFAKSGTINGVKALSGYIQTSNGKNMIFSVITNKANGYTRPAINSIVMSIIDWAEQ